MLKILAFIKRHPIATYFVVAYAISWGGILLLVAPKFLRGETLTFSDTLIMSGPMLAGPTLGSLFTTALIDGRDGLRELWSRIVRWKAAPVWYAWAVLTAPIVILLVLGSLALFVSPAFAPIINPVGVLVGLLVGIFEEIGWTGFAVPRMLSRHTVLTSGIIVGTLWGLWHLVAGYLQSVQTLGGWWFSEFLLVFFIALIAYRSLMVWVYSHTASVPVAMLMHAFYSGTLYSVWPNTPGPEGALWKALLAVGLWIVLAVVVLMFQGELTGGTRPEAVPRVKPA